MSDNFVLLTATITPRSDQPDLVMRDPLERLNDYKKALLFYQELLQRDVVKGLVFAENSGYDLVLLRLLFPDPRIEWLSTKDFDYPTTFHRGYGEFRLIDHAMAHSSAIAAAGAAAVIWKVTGRYIIENLERVIHLAPMEFGLYCRSNGRWAEMSLMAWTRHGHETLLKGVWEQFATGMAPELILAPRLAQSHRSDCKVVTTFVWPPLIIGRRGTDGGQFTSWRARWKFRALLLSKLVLLPFR